MTNLEKQFNIPQTNEQLMEAATREIQYQLESRGYTFELEADQKDFKGIRQCTNMDDRFTEVFTEVVEQVMNFKPVNVQ